MPSAFDNAMAAVTPAFLGIAGEDITYRPLAVGANDKTIKAIVDYESWEKIRINNSAQSGEHVDIEISVRSNSEGHMDPKIYIKDGQGDDIVFPVGHRFAGKTWYVVDRLDDGAHGTMKLVIADKALPLHLLGR